MEFDLYCLNNFIDNESKCIPDPLLTRGQSNLTKSRHRHSIWTLQSYSPGCAHVHSHVIAYVLPWTHPSPHAKRHLDRFSHFSQLTAECLCLQRAASFPLQNCPFARGSGPPLIHAFVSQLQFTTKRFSFKRAHP